MAHRDRVAPTPDQLSVLARQCADARDAGNLALEHTHCDRPGRPMSGSAERSRQLTEARKGTWLGSGSSSVQQQALRDWFTLASLETPYLGFLPRWWCGLLPRRPARSRGLRPGSSTT